MKKHIRLYAILLALLSLSLLLASCSASAKDGAAGESYYEDKNELYNENVSSPSIGGNGMTNTEQKLDPTETTERKIIKTFDIYAEAKDYNAALTALNDLITQHGGYVESASSSDKSLNHTSTNYTRRATYTIRIPAEHAEAFVGSMGTLFNVTSNQSKVEDISESYYSIEARLEELQAERDSLLDILDTPETKKDYDLWLTVTQRLSEVRQEIAVYQGQLNRYDSKVAYSTINLSINEVIAYSSISESNSFGSRLGAAFKEGWSDFVIGLGDFVIWFAEALPTLLLLGAIATVVVLIIRSAVRRKKRKNIFDQASKE